MTQFMKVKPTKWGMNVCVGSGYTLNSSLYLKHPVNTGCLVMDLIRPLCLGTWDHIYMAIQGEPPPG